MPRSRCQQRRSATPPAEVAHGAPKADGTKMLASARCARSDESEVQAWRLATPSLRSSNRGTVVRALVGVPNGDAECVGSSELWGFVTFSGA